MKTLIITAFDKNIEKFANVCNVSKEEYCKKWGLTFISHEIRDIEETHPAWQKLQILIDHINLNQYDYIVWLDSDIIITNYNFDIRTLFDDKYALIFPEDWHAPEGYDPKGRLFSSCSIIINCKTSFSLEILNESNKLTEFKNYGCWDQSALFTVINGNEHYNDLVHRVPRRILNAVDPLVGTIDKGRPKATEPWQPGDFLVHLTGLGDYELNRMPLVKYYMENRIC
jgi:hypothetical protein